MERFIGTAYVAEYDGIVTAEDATDIIEKAKEASISVDRLQHGTFFINITIFFMEIALKEPISL